VIILKAARSDDAMTFTVARSGGGEPFVTTDVAELVDLLVDLGVDNPLPLIAAARQYGVVEIVDPAH
jgi:hypothetical protein